MGQLRGGQTAGGEASGRRLSCTEAWASPCLPPRRRGPSWPGLGPQHGGRNAMLVLSRKVDQAIIIAGKVRVVVAAVSRGTVRLGVQAPQEVVVDREEVHIRKEEF